MVSYLATMFIASLYLLGTVAAVAVAICIYLGVRKAARQEIAEDRDFYARRAAR